MQGTPAAVRGDTRLPLGHILVAERWKNTDLSTGLQGHVKIMYQEDLGVVDFHPSQTVGVVYLTEADVISGATYRRKLTKFRKADRCKGVVLAEKTPLSTQYYQTLQKTIMLDLGLALIPVADQAEAASLLAQMVGVETRPDGNPFRKRRGGSHTDTALLDALQAVPKLGRVKAKALLERFHSLEEICKASVEELTAVLGRAGATHVKGFLNQ